MDELEDHSTFETDDNFDKFVKVDSPRKGSKSNRKSKKGGRKGGEEKTDL